MGRGGGRHHAAAAAAAEPTRVATKTFAAPWLDAYHARFDRAMQFADHEAVDHPVGIVYAVMANVPGEDPAEAYRRLAQDPSSFPPCLLDTQLADPNVPTHCVLVHDGRRRRRCRTTTWTFCDKRRKRPSARAAGRSCCP